MQQRFFDAFQENPIVAAIRSDADLSYCLLTDVRVVFVLYGDVCSICGIVERIKAAGKLAVVHIDLITGLAAKEIAVDFLSRNTRADGVISTRPALIQRAKELGLFTLLRVFVIDSSALSSALNAKQLRPDAVDILPGLMPGIVRTVREKTGLCVLTGGLITQKHEILQALDAGALAISTTNPAVWRM